jgi:predicted secreted protein
MKKLIVVCLLALLTVAAFAGDVSRFVDLGFSPDGRTYFFGQYGKTDSVFRPFAEICVVDVARNDFVQVFSSSGHSMLQDGYSAFIDLKEKYGAFIGQAEEAPPRQVLYIHEDEVPRTSLEFQDYEHSTVEDPLVYSVRLHPTVEGWGKTAKSSFYITLERRRANGLVDRVTVGNPDIKREGVTGYNIERIFTDPTGNRFVFVIAKTLTAETAISVRYMVETVELR